MTPLAWGMLALFVFAVAVNLYHKFQDAKNSKDE
jgi:hypothetical protein